MLGKRAGATSATTCTHAMAPDGYDIAWYRTLKEREYFEQAETMLQTILEGQEPIDVWTELDPTQYFTAMTTLGAFRAAHR